jgi:hypothetical protein
MFQIYAVSAAPICEEGQKLRKDEIELKICCYTKKNSSKKNYLYCRAFNTFKSRRLF